jgi:hypothetical protein
MHSGSGSAQAKVPVPVLTKMFSLPYLFEVLTLWTPPPIFSIVFQKKKPAQNLAFLLEAVLLPRKLASHFLIYGFFIPFFGMHSGFGSAQAEVPVPQQQGSKD